MSEPSAKALFERAVSEHKAGRLGEAETLYRAALASDPSHADSLLHLGIIAHQMGRYDTAIALIERAIALAPYVAAYYCNLGSALDAVGRPDDAAMRYRQALALDPKLADAHYNLGALHQLQGRFEEAGESYRRALSLDPNDVRALNNLGFTLHRRGKRTEAAALYRQAIALAPDYADAHHNLGFLLYEEGQLEAAVAAFDRALALDPGNPDAHNNRGNCLKELGDFRAALDSYARCIAIAPDHAMAHFNRADLKTFTAGDPDFVALETLAIEPESRLGVMAPHAHFAMAKALEDTGDYDRAFEHLLKGNALKRRALAYDEGATAEKFRRIAELFDAAALTRFQGAGETSERPVFIIGMPRSGTTLVEQILASHPSVHAAGELTAMDAVVEAAFAGCFPQGVDGVKAAMLRKMAQDYLARLPTVPEGKIRITDKYPRNFIYAGLIHSALPQARIIHVTRDPADTCVSCFSHLFREGQEYSYDLAELGRYYRLYSRMMEHWRSALPAGAMLEVAYEDLVADVETQTRRILAGCGLPWDDACLSFHATKRAVTTISAVQVRQPIYRTSLQRWRRYEAHLAPLLKALEQA
jgi:tetratricopeptide (TPR) repeat protein